MDIVTLSLSSIENPQLTFLSSLIDNPIIFVFIIFFIIFYFEKNNDKRKKLIIAVILAILVGTIVKDIYKIERPCVYFDSKIGCGTDYSFPSLHSIVIFTIAIGFLDDKKYLVILLAALFIAFSRIYLGVHTFFDVAGSLVLSTIVYGVVDYYWRREK